MKNIASETPTADTYRSMEATDLYTKQGIKPPLNMYLVSINIIYKSPQGIKKLYGRIW
jgi:hypothetical protein